MKRLDLDDLRTRFTVWRWKAVGSFRRPRVLPPEPLGTIVVGYARFPISSITLSGGKIHFTGSSHNPFYRGITAEQAPTYQVLDRDGQLVREGLLSPSMFPMTSTSAMTWTFTTSLDLRGLHTIDGLLR